MTILQQVESDLNITIFELKAKLSQLAETASRHVAEISELGKQARLPERGIIRDQGREIDLLTARALYLKDLLDRFGGTAA